MEFKYIFGPVRSRRLGWSLGIDIVPYKTCSFNCIYCECGRTTNLTVERKEYVPMCDLLSEISVFFEQEAQNCLIDIVTLSGSGEPTLHSEIKAIIKHIRSVTKLPICLITNSSLFYLDEVISDVLDCDIIVPSLDAVSQDVFDKINRPHSKIKVDDVIGGLMTLRSNFYGSIFLEVFLADGINDSSTEISKLVDVICRISPDKVQLNTLDRPPADDWVKAVSESKMMDILGYMQARLSMPVEVIKRYKDDSKVGSLGHKVTPRSVQGRIIQLISRRPATFPEIVEYVGLPSEEVEFYLNNMTSSGALARSIVNEQIFFKRP